MELVAEKVVAEKLAVEEREGGSRQSKPRSEQPTSDCTRIRVDREQIRRALINIVSNAIQACASPSNPENETRPPQRVSIACSKTPTGVDIRVTDTGHGIPSALTEKILTPFFTTREKGTGLGLALSRKIIMQHGGSLQIESTSSAGTTVRIQLPAPQTASVAPNAATTIALPLWLQF